MLKTIRDAIGTTGTLPITDDTSAGQVRSWLSRHLLGAGGSASSTVDDETSERRRAAVTAIIDWSQSETATAPDDEAVYLGLVLTDYTPLEEIDYWLEQVEEAQMAFRRAVRGAVAAGEAKTRVAQHAEITRTTLDRWLKESA